MSVRLALLSLLLVAAGPAPRAHAQYTDATRAGFRPVRPHPQDQAASDDPAPAPSRSFFAPPTQDHFVTSLGYVGLTSALGAGALSVAFQDPNCRGCTLWGAAIGSSLGAAVGAKVARSMLHCEHSSWDAREAFASFVVQSTALMIGHSNRDAGLWTATLGAPLVTSYFVAGCDQR